MGTSIFLLDSTTTLPISQLQFGFVQSRSDTTFTPHRTPPTCPMIAITYTNRVFYETALGFSAAIKALGIHSVEIWGDMSPAFSEKYTHKYATKDGCDELPLQIAIAPHEDTILLPRYVVLHMEQTWSVFSTRDHRYKQVVENAKAVWLMSWNGMQSFTGLAIDRRRIYVIPLYTRFDYALKSRDRLESADYKDIKVDKFSMLGSFTLRREEIISEMGALAAYMWGAIANPSALYFSRERDVKLIKFSKVQHM